MNTHEIDVENRVIRLYGKEAKINMSDWDFENQFRDKIVKTTGGTPIHELLMEIMELENTSLFGIQTKRISVTCIDHYLTDIDFMFDGDENTTFQVVKQQLLLSCPEGTFTEQDEYHYLYEKGCYWIRLQNDDKSKKCYLSISALDY